ncbi:MAG: sugar phosphate isomerase/epimerase [Clostridia bacterium]|nr:sugar phosphate isomerase/epimerase [Clostridia bacterium]
MYNFPIGVMLHSFRCETQDAIEKAAKIGAKGIQLLATYGKHSPEELVGEKRKELMDMMKSNGLCFSALCGDFGVGFFNPETNPEMIEKSKRVLDLAKELETNIVTTHIGVIPEDKNTERYKIMQEACFELSRYADSLDAHFAIETGPEIATTLKMFLDDLGSKGVAVNYDPANFVMVTGDDPVKGVYTLKDYIVHTHAKDGVRLKDSSPEEIYKYIDEEKHSGREYLELPLGQGKVDFDNYLKALEEVGYRGYLTIEREVGANPADDIKLAADFLRNKIATL